MDIIGWFIVGNVVLVILKVIVIMLTSEKDRY